MAADGSVSLRLSVLPVPKPAKKPGAAGLAQLRDFLAQGQRDPFANNSCVSVTIEETQARRGDREVRWGCLCRGNVSKGGVELECGRCNLTFHAKCEKLDYSCVGSASNPASAAPRTPRRQGLEPWSSLLRCSTRRVRVPAAKGPRS